MSSATLYRWSGVLLIIGAPVALVGSVLQTVLYHSHQHTAQDVSSSGWPLVTGLIFVGYILITLGFPGL